MPSSTITSIHDLHEFADDKNRKTPFLIDPVTGSVVTIGYTHHEAHEGKLYSFNARVSGLSDGGEYKVRVTTPAGSSFHFKEVSAWMNNAQGIIELIEAPIASGGVAVTVFNRNRTVSATSGITVAQSATSTGGTIIDNLYFGGGGANVASKVGGDNTTEIEWIFNSSTTYVLNMINLSGAAATMTVRTTGYKEP